jgi:hypothetical protein
LSTSPNGGDGGTGQVSSIDGTRKFYAGGGGGGSYNKATIALGVAGGGDSASNTTFTGISGVANSGGGGGGGTVTGATRGNGGNGGSGIVIIRYPQNLAPPAGTTGNPQIRYNNGYQIYIWTSSGTVTF